MAHSPMKAIGRIVFVVIAAGLVIGLPVTAQIKNPIQAAKDAFKKAREEEEAKRSQRPPRTPQTSQPANPPNTSAAPSDAVGGDCCSPDALKKIAASAGFLDIVGIKLGMTPDQAFAAVKAFNGQMKMKSSTRAWNSLTVPRETSRQFPSSRSHIRLARSPPRIRVLSFSPMAARKSLSSNLRSRQARRSWQESCAG